MIELATILGMVLAFAIWVKREQRRIQARADELRLEALVREYERESDEG